MGREEGTTTMGSSPSRPGRAKPQLPLAAPAGKGAWRAEPLPHRGQGAVGHGLHRQGPWGGCGLGESM
jgi:hypothetical protein